MHNLHCKMKNLIRTHHFCDISYWGLCLVYCAKFEIYPFIVASNLVKLRVELTPVYDIPGGNIMQFVQYLTTLTFLVTWYSSQVKLSPTLTFICWVFFFSAYKMLKYCAMESIVHPQPLFHNYYDKDKNIMQILYKMLP